MYIYIYTTVSPFHGIFFYHGNSPQSNFPKLAMLLQDLRVDNFFLVLFLKSYRLFGILSCLCLVVLSFFSLVVFFFFLTSWLIMMIGYVSFFTWFPRKCAAKILFPWIKISSICRMAMRPKKAQGMKQRRVDEVGSRNMTNCLLGWFCSTPDEPNACAATSKVGFVVFFNNTKPFGKISKLFFLQAFTATICSKILVCNCMQRLIRHYPLVMVV